MSSVARRFHDETTHTPYSVRTSGHTLDWDNKPFPFKIYTDVPAVALPRDIDGPAVPTLARTDTGAARGPAHAGGADGGPLLHGGGDQEEDVPRRGRGALPRGGFHRRASIRRRSMSSPATSTVWSPGSITSARAISCCAVCARAMCGSVLAEAAADPSLARSRRDAGAERDLLAEHVEVPGARLSPPVLGLRHDARERAGRGRRAGPGARRLSPASSTTPSIVCSASMPEREAALELLPLGPAARPRRRPARRRRSLTTSCRSPSDEVDYPALREIHRATGLRHAGRRRRLAPRGGRAATRSRAARSSRCRSR